ncbi:DUF3397 family protein [Schleiferilactobacillus shenzhenensis]|uniref:DUF3397 domain-containing protein n=1 Tax=Schleiferilactobacillus shenzhenensis LY-73 TaxID=1231336 RepID=U4TQI8_9LACO|nr:DUF3397 family protein [Schleiferilactobacillus shenzhenensis]ERL66469.1 hypothetical protein L248_0148 [Schleiferilactobacillus shenzhenensis LY-73]
MGDWIYLAFLPIIMVLGGGGYNYLSARWHGKPLHLVNWLVLPQFLGVFILTYPAGGVGMSLLPICVLTAVVFGLVYLVFKIVRDRDLLLGEYWRSVWRYWALLSGGWYVFALVVWLVAKI